MVEAEQQAAPTGELTFTNVEVPECVMNDAVRAFEPSLEDIFFIIPSGDYQRLLFQGQDLREREETHLADFRNFLKVKNLTLPPGYDDENLLVLRFLQGLKWDYQKTYDEITQHAEWRQQLVLDGNQFREDLQLGVMYGLRRDNMQHPIVIVNVRRMIDTGISVDRLVALGDFLLNYIITYAMIPGKIESWTAIFDMKDVGVTEIPKDRIQPLVRTMTKNYRGRLFRMYSTDVTWVVRQLWKVAHRFVDEFTTRKLCIYGDDYGNDLKSIIAPENLEQRYGGTMPNVTEDFFPPKFNP